MKQTLKQWQALRHGAYYDHDPRHFRFARTCPGFAPDKNPARGDVLVFAFSLVLLALLALGVL